MRRGKSGHPDGDAAEADAVASLGSTSDFNGSGSGRSAVTKPVAVAQQMLASLAQYVGTDRLYELEGDAVPGDCAVERWQGWEQLSLGFEWWVDVLSGDSAWALDG